MLAYEMMVVVDEGGLEKALIERFGEDAMGSHRNCMSNVLFGDEYNNDSYKSYYFQEDEKYTGEFWQDEECIRIRNLLNSILREMFPTQEKILVDVSW